MEENDHTVMLRFFLAVTAVFLLSACAGPTVNLATSQPIKVDISMRLDVYQHNRDGIKKPGANTTAVAPVDPEASRRNRMADVQLFKNSRLVGESRDGLLSIQGNAPGDYGEYVRKTVAQENADRMAMMKASAEKDKTPLSDLQQKQAELWRNRAFTGELIEVQEAEGSWKWIPKPE